MSCHFMKFGKVAFVKDVIRTSGAAFLLYASFVSLHFHILRHIFETCGTFWSRVPDSALLKWVNALVVWCVMSVWRCSRCRGRLTAQVRVRGCSSKRVLLFSPNNVPEWVCDTLASHLGLCYLTTGSVRWNPWLCGVITAAQPERAGAIREVVSQIQDPLRVNAVSENTSDWSMVLNRHVTLCAEFSKTLCFITGAQKCPSNALQ